MSVLEKDIEQTVVDWAKAHGFLALKVTFTENGYPDRLFISPSGHTIFIEFKRPGEVPRALQSFRIADLVKRGVPATWTCSAVEAINMLRECLGPTRVPRASDPVTTLSGLGGSISGSRLGKDFHSFGGFEDSFLKALGQTGTDSGPTTTNVQRVAGRDKEVGEFQQLDLFNPPRDPEGDGPNYGLTDTLD